MKKRIFPFGVMTLLLAACSVNEIEIAPPSAKETEEFLATIENASSRVFVDNDLMVLWHADDCVSIFNRYTYNQQYRFTGNTGSNSGSFTKVPNDDFITGNSLNSVYAIYPYKESTEINNQGVLTVDLPATQSYAVNSFGIGSNTMVSCSEGHELLFKNLCGYIMLKLYGDNIRVKSISIKGNNDEPLAGKATVKASIDNDPTMSFGASAAKEITLTFDTPIALGTTAETATSFWLVVPPTTFSKGISLTVKDDKNWEFKKSTTASLQISRNTLKRMSVLQATPEPSDDAIVFADSKLKECLVTKFDTNGDGDLSYKEAAAVTSIEGAVTIKTISSFDEFQYFTGVTYIPKSCFESWSNLNSIVLPASISHIDNLAFKDCIALSELVLPDSVSRLGYGVFYGCSALKRMVLPHSISGELGFIFDTKPNYSDQIYEMGLFQGCSSLEEVILPNSVTALGVNLFYMCTSLNSLEIPASIKKYSYGTFQGCKKLSGIQLPNTTTTIPGYLFYGCENMTSIIIPQTVTRINNGAFGNTGIESILIPESVTYIGESTFSGTKLTSITIPESISYIENYLFSGCSELVNVTIPESVTGIGKVAFANCFKLKSIVIPNSVTTIGNEAFRGCIGLTSISIPESVTSIGQRAFSRCTNLTSLSLPNTSICLNESFEYCTALKSIEIPANIDGFQYAFQYCTGLKSVILSEGLQLISMYAFLGCDSIESIIIPESVTHILNGAFMSCSGLSCIMVKSSIPPTGSIQMFADTNNCPIYVPEKSVDNYRASNRWSDYADRIQAIPSFNSIPEAVDLGLPSGLKWASFNLGASKPEEYGDYYAWGETEPYYSSQDPLIWKEDKESGYYWSSYKWCIGDWNMMTKYCNDSSCGYNDFTDTKTVLDLEDDAVSANLGGLWRMPTETEWTELRTNCTWTWAKQNGVNGRLVTARNGNSIFLPAAGAWGYVLLSNASSSGSYWSSSLYMDNPSSACFVAFNSGYVSMGYSQRGFGYSVRPVYAE